MRADERRVPTHRRKLDAALVGVTIVLVAATVAVAQQPHRGALGSNLPVQMVISTVMTVGTWLLATLAWLRFRELRAPSLLYQGAAFASVSLVNAYFLIVAVQEAGQPVQGDPSPAAILAFSVGRLVLGAMLLAGGLAAVRRTRRISGRARAALLVGPILLAILVGLGAAFPGIWRSPEALPVIGWAGSHSVAAGLLVHLPIGALFLIGSILYRGVYAREPQAANAALSLGLLVAAFAQVHFAMEPGVHSARITSEEILRIAMYGLLVAGIAVQTGTDVRQIVHANRDLERLRQIEVERKALEDRERLAQEVHDGIAQDLWLTKLAYGQLRAKLPPELEPLAEDVELALDGAVATTRQAISWMETASTSPSPFADALADIAREFADRFGLRVDVVSQQTPTLEPTVQVELLRITQEALRNTLKHANASLATVSLSVDAGWLEIVIQDNGRGFDLDHVPVGSFGLMTMSRRADVIGARLQVTSRPRAGTRVTVQLRLGAPRTIQPNDLRGPGEPARGRQQTSDTGATAS